MEKLTSSISSAVHDITGLAKGTLVKANHRRTPYDVTWRNRDLFLASRIARISEITGMLYSTLGIEPVSHDAAQGALDKALGVSGKRFARYGRQAGFTSKRMYQSHRHGKRGFVGQRRRV